MAKELKLKIRKIWGLILSFVEVTGEKLVVGAFLLPHFLSRVNTFTTEGFSETKLLIYVT